MKTFISQLKQALEKPLPFKKAHLEAAPYRKIDFENLDLSNVKHSAVLMLFYKKNDTIFTVLIHRQTYDGKHSGQIAFPGGKQEKHDKNNVATALREANEEIGVNPNYIEVIGELSKVYIPVSNFYVSPILAFYRGEPNFTLDKREVADIFELDLSLLLKVKKLFSHKITLSNGVKMNVPTFQFADKIIWGATALMLNELRYILK